MKIQVAVITISDRAAAGIFEDKSGPLARELLQEAGLECGPPIVVPDEAADIKVAIRKAHRSGARTVLTTGGTGIGPRDITPEVTAELADQYLPGLVEAMRAAGAKNSPHTMISRGKAGVLNVPGHPPALIVNAPGSPGGVRDTVGVVAPIIKHVVEQLDGEYH